MNKQELLNYLKITKNDYDVNFYNISNKFFVPSKLRRFFRESEIDECFINIAGNILTQINLLLGGRIFQYIELSKNYDEFVEHVGKSRVDNLRSAVYEEIKFRVVSNSFPEFANQENVMPSNLQHFGTKRDYTNIENYLCPTATILIINSAWNKLELPNYDKIKDLFETNSELNKMINQNSTNIENNTQMLIAYGHKVDEIDLNTKANAQKIIDVNSTLESKINTNKSFLDNHIQNTNQMISSVQAKNNEQDQKLADLTVKVDSNQKGLMQVNDGFNNLYPSINAIRHKTEQIDLALQANTQADSETLKKFNELNTKYATEYAEVSTKISNAQNINNQQATDITLLKNKTASLETNVYQKTDIDSKFNDFSSKVIEIKQDKVNAKMWLDLFVNNGGDHDNSYIDYEKNQINLMRAQEESETQLEPAKITLIENEDKAELTLSKIKDITNNTTKINNLESNVYTKQEIDNKLEALTTIANISKENIDILKLVTSRLKTYNDVVNSFANPNLDNAAPGSSISANGKSCILMSKKITFVDTSYACRREGNCQPKRYSIILWEAD